jgi:hypothetical protein
LPLSVEQFANNIGFITAKKEGEVIFNHENYAIRASRSEPKLYLFGPDYKTGLFGGYEDVAIFDNKGNLIENVLSDSSLFNF